MAVNYASRVMDNRPHFFYNMSLPFLTQGVNNELKIVTQPYNDEKCDLFISSRTKMNCST